VSTTKIEETQSRRGLKSYNHPRFLAYTQVKKPSRWVPKWLYFLYDEHIGKTGRVLDISLTAGGKVLFFVYFDMGPPSVLSAYFEWQLDFDTPTKLTEKERQMLGITQK